MYHVVIYVFISSTDLVSSPNLAILGTNESGEEYLSEVKDPRAISFKSIECSIKSCMIPPFWVWANIKTQYYNNRCATPRTFCIQSIDKILVYRCCSRLVTPYTSAQQVSWCYQPEPEPTPRCQEALPYLYYWVGWENTNNCKARRCMPKSHQHEAKITQEKEGVDELSVVNSLSRLSKAFERTDFYF